MTAHQLIDELVAEIEAGLLDDRTFSPDTQELEGV